MTGCSPSASVVQSLLAAGADPQHMDHKGLTALDYANRKLARLNLRPRRKPRKSPSLDENRQILLARYEQEMLDEVRRDHPEWAQDFVNSYRKERLRAARRVFNDPGQVERIVKLLEAAIKKRK